MGWEQVEIRSDAKKLACNQALFSSHSVKHSGSNATFGSNAIRPGADSFVDESTVCFQWVSSITIFASFIVHKSCTAKSWRRLAGSSQEYKYYAGWP